jgi:hypothetical protein
MQKIEFLKDHLGHNKGSTKVVGSDVANDLVNAGVVQILHSVSVAKSIDFPPVNKMVEKPEKKKGLSRVK